jgi:hypothetical protein
MNGDKDTLRDEYPEDLIRSGVRGKYAKRYREGTSRRETAATAKGRTKSRNVPAVYFT